jgi:hypothetical protein
VYCYDPDQFVENDVLPLKAPVRGAAVLVRAVSPRILNQSAVLTAHGPPWATIEEKPHRVALKLRSLVRLVVPAEMKVPLLRHLNDYGVNDVTLFPDLDGLSRHSNWGTERMAAVAKAKTETPTGDGP